jgi:hypothetical protein
MMTTAWTVLIVQDESLSIPALASEPQQRLVQKIVGTCLSASLHFTENHPEYDAGNQ